MNCGQCAFWTGRFVKDQPPTVPTPGECKRHAPVVGKSKYSDDPRAVWPETWSYNGCGDWQDFVCYS
jgi:hypothetical protein